MTDTYATTDRSHYGAAETNGLVNPDAYHDEVDYSRRTAFEDSDLVSIVRLRLISDPGYPVWDLSYCHGRTQDGTLVPVDLPRSTFPKRGLHRALVQMAAGAGRYGKGMGLLDAVSTCQ